MEGEREKKKSNQWKAMLRKSTSWAGDDVGSQTVGGRPGMGVVFWWRRRSDVLIVGSAPSTNKFSSTQTPHTPRFPSHLFSHSVFHRNLSISVSRTNAITHSHPLFFLFFFFFLPPFFSPSLPRSQSSRQLHNGWHLLNTGSNWKMNEFIWA